MGKTTKLLILLVLLLQSQQIKANPVWIEFKDFDPVIEEILFNDLKNMTKGLVDWRRDYNYGYDKGVSYDGGITVQYTDVIESRTTNFYSYNLDNEQIYRPLVRIGEPHVLQYLDDNRIYALKNSVNHEIMCHILPRLGNDGHTTWGLCRPDLSTDKMYWGKRHRKRLAKFGNTEFRTGEVLE